MSALAQAPGAGFERVRFGPIENPVRGVLHGGAAAGALAMLALLHTAESPPPHPWAYTVFAVTQALLYLTSALYHSVPWRPAAKARMQRLDHAMILVAVAGTVTAIDLLGLDGPWRAALIAQAWATALLGASLRLRRGARVRHTTPLCIALGLLAVPGLPHFAERFPGPPCLLLATGILSFALGGACFVTRSPTLWPRVFSFHEVFHVCTVIGSGAHYTLFVRYLWQGG